jgi:hypothetical protein
LVRRVLRHRGYFGYCVTLCVIMDARLRDTGHETSHHMIFVPKSRVSKSRVKNAKL